MASCVEGATGSGFSGYWKSSREELYSSSLVFSGSMLGHWIWLALSRGSQLGFPSSREPALPHTNGCGCLSLTRSQLWLTRGQAQPCNLLFRLPGNLPSVCPDTSVLQASQEGRASTAPSSAVCPCIQAQELGPSPVVPILPLKEQVLDLWKTASPASIWRLK